MSSHPRMRHAAQFNREQGRAGSFASRRPVLCGPDVDRAPGLLL